MPSSPTYETNTPIIKQVSDTIDKFAMFAPGDKVLVGVSGGPDSVALLHLLNTVAPTYQIELAVAHLDHGLRPLADGKETELVKQLAGNLGLAFYVEAASLDSSQGSLEERARNVRYAFFNSVARDNGYHKIALGHHAQDNAEAVLLHLFRGSGLRGLSGIPPVRDNRIVRPLVDLHREDILAYLQQLEIPFMLDDSNADLRFDRNRIRHHLIPLLKTQYNPDIVATLHRMAGLCRDEDQWCDRLLVPTLEQIEFEVTPQYLILDTGPLVEQSLAAQRRLIRSALRRWRGDLKRISAHHVDALLRLASLGQGRLNLPAGLAAEYRHNRLQFTYLENPRCFPDLETLQFCHAIEAVHCLPEKIEIPEIRATMAFAIGAPPAASVYQRPDNHTAWFDLNGLDFPLYIRNVEQGDRFSPLGAPGGRKIKKILIDCKIPRDKRGQTALLTSAVAVYWIAGLRRSSAALITTATEKALCVTCHYHDPPKAAALK